MYLATYEVTNNNLSPKLKYQNLDHSDTVIYKNSFIYISTLKIYIYNSVMI